MNLPDEAIEEFRQLWAATTHESIDFDFAKKQAESFLMGMRGVFDHSTHSKLSNQPLITNVMPLPRADPNT